MPWMEHTFVFVVFQIKYWKTVLWFAMYFVCCKMNDDTLDGTVGKLSATLRACVTP